MSRWRDLALNSQMLPRACLGASEEVFIAWNRGVFNHIFSGPQLVIGHVRYQMEGGGQEEAIH